MRYFEMLATYSNSTFINYLYESFECADNPDRLFSVENLIIQQKLMQILWI